MNRLSILQGGETAEVVSCLAFQRETTAIRAITEKLIHSMRRGLQSDVLEAIFPSPTIALGWDGKPVYAVDATYMQQDIASDRVLPAWAKE